MGMFIFIITLWATIQTLTNAAAIQQGPPPMTIVFDDKHQDTGNKLLPAVQRLGNSNSEFALDLYRTFLTDRKEGKCIFIILNSVLTFHLDTLCQCCLFLRIRSSVAPQKKF